MWRSVLLARKASSISSKFTGATNSIFIRNVPQVNHSIPSYFSTFCPIRISFYQTTRFFSIDSSHEIQGTESPVIADHVFDESPSRISSEFEERSETNDTLQLDGFAFGEDETSVVEEEKETHEVDLEELEAVLSLLQSSGGADVSIESSLEKMNLKPHEEFVVSVLETPLVPGENLMAFFKWALNRPEFSIATRSLYALVRAMCSELKKKNAYAVWDFVKEVGVKEIGVVNTEILNELISVFSRLGKGKAGFEVFKKFDEFDCVPNSDTYYFTIEGLCKRKMFDCVDSVCEKMLNEGKLPAEEKSGKTISLLCKCGGTKHAHSVYISMKEKNKYPPQSSLNYLISSLCRDDKTVSLAFEMLEDISDKDRKYAIMPFSYVVRGLCRMNDVERAKNLLHKMIDAGPPPGNAVFNSVINSLAKSGDLEEAKKMVKVMESRGLKPDVYTYSVIMSGYVKGGEMEKAIEVLAEAKKKHSKLSPVTYHTLIRGYCKLEEFDKAVELLSEMKEFGVEPNADEYNKLIQSICLKNLDLGTAQKLLEEMKENDLHLNGITKALVNAVKELVEEGQETKEVAVEA